MMFEKFQIIAWQELKDKNKNILDMQVGLFSEIGTLLQCVKNNPTVHLNSLEKRIERSVGGALWYLANIRSLNNLQFYKPIGFTVFNSQEHICKELLRWDYSVEGRTNMLIAHLWGIAEYFELDIEQILEDDVKESKAILPD